MKISKFGGLIAAASKKAALPMLKVGTIPVIKRIVISFQQAGIFPIVVITGVDEDEVKYQLSNYGVIFISSEQPEQPQLLDSVKVGLRYLSGKCERIAFAPVNVPMFTPDTLIKLKNTAGKIVTPSYRGCGGHPVIRMSIEREFAFFNVRFKLLLFLIADTHNMRQACGAMSRSYGKAWDMINRLKIELGYAVVERRQGGRHGGDTVPTERGLAFLLAYQRFEEEIFHYAQSRFQEAFLTTKIL